MAKPQSSSVVTVVLITLFILAVTPSAYALGSGATLAVSSTSATVCGIAASQPTQSIQCYRSGQTIHVGPNISFSSISGGRKLLCGLRSGGHSLLCWDTADFSNSSFAAKSFYFKDDIVPLENLSVGDYQICATVVGTGSVNCWRGNNTFQLPSGSNGFVSISSGFGFSCGILRNSHQVRCWGNNTLLANQMQGEFGNMSMTSIVAGGSHVCGLNSTGFVVCKGNNDSGQLNVPSNSAWEFSTLALGESHSCGIRGTNGSVVCWGGEGEYSVNVTQGVSFETIASGSNFTCGLTTGNFSIICWGPGWPGEKNYSSGAELPLPATLPGPCNIQSNSSCECGVYPQSQRLCSGLGNICKPCLTQISMPQQAPLPSQPLPLPPPVASRPTNSPPSSSISPAWKWGAFAFCMVGFYCMFSSRVCCGKKMKSHNSVLPTFTRATSPNNGTTWNTSSTIALEGSRIMSHQRSGTSSNHADRADEFPLAELAAATNYFSPANKIGRRGFGVVYRGKLTDGREVAIKRADSYPKKKRSAFDSELVVLSRLHHKHLVRLVGYCEEEDERILAFEYMKNRALFDHLHDQSNVEKSSSVLNSWNMRIKIALDVARGIEYLHDYAVPPIIHQDIKSSNILFDTNWTARVSYFGLSLVSPKADRKSDVYGLGIVLLELLTGKTAVFYGEDEETPTTVMDFAVPAIMAGELVKVLDSRVGLPAQNERESVELMADTAMRCVNFKGKERPTMAEIVNNLEVALALFDLMKFIFGRGVASDIGP